MINLGSKKRWRFVVSWIETIVITLIILAIGFYFRPTDPFFEHAAFPWVWFAPVLIALRYGVFLGLCSAIAIMIAFIAVTPQSLLATSNRLFLLSGLLLALLCGAYQKFWLKRIRHAEGVKNYIQERIQNISNSYNVLALSHDRLEQSFISKPITLRSALTELQKILANASGIISEKTANELLQLLAYYCSLEVAGLHLMKNEKIDPTPIAKIGNNKAYDSDNILIKKCLENKLTTYIAINQFESNLQSCYLAVAPLITSNLELLGLLTIEEIPFLSLNEETLKTLSMLLTYFADSIAERDLGKELLKKYPNCPLEFASELYKLHNLQQRIGVESALVRLTFYPDPKRDNCIFKIEQERRGLDSPWRISGEKCEILLVLMPLSGRGSVMAYENRIKKLAEENFGIIDNHKVLLMDYQLLSARQNPVAIVDELLEKI